jgi:hypothetical protein
MHHLGPDDAGLSGVYSMSYFILVPLKF